MVKGTTAPSYRPHHIQEHQRGRSADVATGWHEVVPIHSLNDLRVQAQRCRFPCLLELMATAISAEAAALNAQQQGSLESQAYWGRLPTPHGADSVIRKTSCEISSPAMSQPKRRDRSNRSNLSHFDDRIEVI